MTGVNVKLRLRRLRLGLCAGRSPGILAHWAGGDPDPARARPDGRCQRAGVSPPGPPFRRRARLLGDGQLRGAFAQEREDARLLAHRCRRASARGSDLRRRAGRHGRSGTDGRGRGRRPRRHQLRLPGAQGDEDRRGRHVPRRARPRVPHRRGGRRGDLDPGLGEDAPRDPERLAHVPRDRAQARRSGRGHPHAPPALGAADVHRRGRPLADGRARRARRRPRHRLWRHHLPRQGADRARDDRRGGGHGRPRSPGESVGAGRDHGRGTTSRPARRSSPSSSSSFARPCASSGNSGRPDS